MFDAIATPADRIFPASKHANSTEPCPASRIYSRKDQSSRAIATKDLVTSREMVDAAKGENGDLCNEYTESIRPSRANDGTGDATAIRYANRLR